ncbi:apoptosis regulator BAX-like [Labeo rohita]|uniref:apoptosis regulator BAX-like n=1 Tax=Labeo rohita TaxID=84645 RepID=UPI0021E2B83D|nr:apoptosis regulator BAX-like [Labeo rohita]
MELDYQFSENLVLRSVKDQVQRAGTCVPSLPEPQPMSAEREQLLDQVANVIRVIGDSLDQKPEFNDMVDGFARVADRQSFQMLVNKVFVDDITWGKIVTLICVVGKSIAKILADFVSGFVSWTLDYFRNNLLRWICNRGGWINSISSLARYSFERDFGTSSSLTSLSCGVFFISGLLLGGLIVWRLNRSA